MITIKIGREVITFTEEDVFIDNGACIQCKTKKGKHEGYGRYGILMLTKKALKELESKCERKIIEVTKSKVQYFSYTLKEV